MPQHRSPSPRAEFTYHPVLCHHFPTCGFGTSKGYSLSSSYQLLSVYLWRHFHQFFIKVLNILFTNKSTSCSCYKAITSFILPRRRTFSIMFTQLTLLIISQCSKKQTSKRFTIPVVTDFQFIAHTALTTGSQPSIVCFTFESIVICL